MIMEITYYSIMGSLHIQSNIHFANNVQDILNRPLLNLEPHTAFRKI